MPAAMTMITKMIRQPIGVGRHLSFGTTQKKKTTSMKNKSFFFVQMKGNATIKHSQRNFFRGDAYPHYMKIKLTIIPSKTN